MTDISYDVPAAQPYTADTHCHPCNFFAAKLMLSSAKPAYCFDEHDAILPGSSLTTWSRQLCDSLHAAPICASQNSSQTPVSTPNHLPHLLSRPSYLGSHSAFPSAFLLSRHSSFV